MHTLLLVSGSVASRLTPKLSDALSALGPVKIACSEHARHFIPEETPVLTDQDEWQWQKKGDSILHIDLRNWADVAVMAPLTAHTLSKISHGMADNLITSVVRAWNYSKPLILAPSMNTLMWENPFTKRQLTTLEEFGAVTVPPVTKTMMCGETGMGALAHINEIVLAAQKAYQIQRSSV